MKLVTIAIGYWHAQAATLRGVYEAGRGDGPTSWSAWRRARREPASSSPAVAINKVMLAAHHTEGLATPLTAPM